MAIVLEKGKKSEIGAKVGLSCQGVSQILSGKRPTSPKGRMVKSLAYEAGGLVAMNLSFKNEKDGNTLMICSWSDGAVQLIHSFRTGATYKYVCGEMVDSWQGLTIPDFVGKQKECEKFAALNF